MLLCYPPKSERISSSVLRPSSCNSCWVFLWWFGLPWLSFPLWWFGPLLLSFFSGGSALLGWGSLWWFGPLLLSFFCGDLGLWVPCIPVCWGGSAAPFNSKSSTLDSFQEAAVTFSLSRFVLSLEPQPFCWALKTSVPIVISPYMSIVCMRVWFQETMGVWFQESIVGVRFWFQIFLCEV